MQDIVDALMRDGSQAGRNKNHPDHVEVAELVKRPAVKAGSYGGSNPSLNASRAVGVG